MEVWKRVTDPEYDALWDRFDTTFPSFITWDRGTAPIAEPRPSRTWSISAAFADRPRDPESGDLLFGPLEQDLNVKALAAFRQCAPPDQPLYVLDWQHPAYRFWPHRFADGTVSEAWPVPVLPDGDYAIFLAEDFSFGLLGHPWEETICVFGAPLLAAFQQHRPALFTIPIRQDGHPVMREPETEPNTPSA